MGKKHTNAAAAALINDEYAKMLISDFNYLTGKQPLSIKDRNIDMNNYTPADLFIIFERCLLVSFHAKKQMSEIYAISSFCEIFEHLCERERDSGRKHVFSYCHKNYKMQFLRYLCTYNKKIGCINMDNVKIDSYGKFVLYQELINLEITNPMIFKSYACILFRMSWDIKKLFLISGKKRESTNMLSKLPIEIILVIIEECERDKINVLKKKIFDFSSDSIKK